MLRMQEEVESADAGPYPAMVYQPQQQACLLGSHACKRVPSPSSAVIFLQESVPVEEQAA